MSVGLGKEGKTGFYIQLCNKSQKDSFEKVETETGNLGQVDREAVDFSKVSLFAMSQNYIVMHDF